MQQGPRYNVPPPSTQRMAFNNNQQQQQAGVMSGWPVRPPQSVENGLVQPYPHMEMEQPLPPLYPQEYFSPSPPMYEMYVGQSMPLPSKEIPGRASIAVCASCNFHNYLWESELLKCDEIIASQKKENEALKKENEALRLKIEQLIERTKSKRLKEEKRNEQEIIDIKIATSSCKGLSPDAIEFSPKRKEEVPVVSIKEMDEVTHGEHQLVDVEEKMSKPEIVPSVSQAMPRNAITATNENEQAACKVPVAEEDTRNKKTYPDQDLEKHPDSKANHENWRNKNPYNNSKRRSSDVGNNAGPDGPGKKYSEPHQTQDGYKKVFNKKSDQDGSNTRNQKNYRTNNEGAMNASNSGGSSSRNNMDRKRLDRNNFSKQDNRNSRVPNEEEHGRRRRNDNPRQSQDNNFPLSEEKRTYNDSYSTWSKMPSIKNIVKEVDGDLFSAPTDFSLGHCVAQDFRMGSGIAVKFKQEFKGTGELLSQNVPVGGCAYLKDSKNNRYIFYLVTKAISSGKPTMESLHKSLEELRRKCQEFEVTKLAIPRIGCGLDRLDWDTVKYKINMVFKDVDIDIRVYNFNVEGQPECEGKKPLGPLGPRVKYQIMRLKDIDKDTALLCFGTEDGHMDSTAISLDDKFNFQPLYKKATKVVGNVWVWDKSKDYYIYSIIVSKTFVKNQICFVTLEKCLKDLSTVLKKDQFQFVGLECLTDWSDDDTFTEKVVTMLRHSLPRTVYELWVCYKNEEADKHELCSKYTSKQQNSQY